MGRPKIHENRIEYIDKWQREHYGKIMIKLPKEEIAKIRAYASVFGPNMSRFVLFACNAFAKQIEDDMTEEEKQACEKRIDDCVNDYLKMMNEKNMDTDSE